MSDNSTYDSIHNLMFIRKAAQAQLQIVYEITEEKK